MYFSKQFQLLIGQMVFLQKLMVGDEFLRTISSQDNEPREAKLMPLWSLHPYVPVSGKLMSIASYVKRNVNTKPLPKHLTYTIHPAGGKKKKTNKQQHKKKLVGVANQFLA